MFFLIQNYFYQKRRYFENDSRLRYFVITSCGAHGLPNCAIEFAFGADLDCKTSLAESEINTRKERP